jgi:hypothetical protein
VALIKRPGSDRVMTLGLGLCGSDHTVAYPLHALDRDRQLPDRRSSAHTDSLKTRSNLGH